MRESHDHIVVGFVGWRVIRHNDLGAGTGAGKPRMQVPVDIGDGDGVGEFCIAFAGLAEIRLRAVEKQEAWMGSPRFPDDFEDRQDPGERDEGAASGRCGGVAIAAHERCEVLVEVGVAEFGIFPGGEDRPVSVADASDDGGSVGPVVAGRCQFLA